MIAPDAEIAVVAHELVHLHHPDHTKAFWARLGDSDRRKLGHDCSGSE